MINESYSPLSFHIDLSKIIIRMFIIIIATPISIDNIEVSSSILIYFYSYAINR